METTIPCAHTNDICFVSVDFPAICRINTYCVDSIVLSQPSREILFQIIDKFGWMNLYLRNSNIMWWPRSDHMTMNWVRCQFIESHTYDPSTLSQKLTNRWPLYRTIPLKHIEDCHLVARKFMMNEKSCNWTSKQWNANGIKQNERTRKKATKQTNKIEKLDYIKMLFMVRIFLRNKFWMLMCSFMILTPVKV